MIEVTKPANIKKLMKQHEITPLKQLGQNFLLNDQILDDIADCIDVNDQDTVLEIGPGMGALTQKLVKRAKKVVAVEIDRGILPVLEKTMEGADNIKIIHGDILKQDLAALHNELGGGDFKVCANLPYYITTPIIMKFIMSDLPCTMLSFLIQKEVAQRMASAPSKKSYGSLSIAVQYHAQVDVVMDVARENFYPVPNVDSVVVRLKKQAPAVQVQDEKLFFELTKYAFAQRRKTLLNNLLASTFKLSRSQAETLILSCGFPSAVRAENLTLQDFANLSDALKALLDKEETAK